MRMINICKRELISSFKDPKRLLFLIGALWAYFLIFGALYIPAMVRGIPLVIYDAAQTSLSRQLVQEIEENDTFSWQIEVNNEEAMLKSLADKEAIVSIEIPADFSKEIQRGHYSNVMFMVNGSNMVFTSVSGLALQDTVNAFSDKVAVTQMELRTGVNKEILSQKLTPVFFNWRIINNPTQSYVLFFCVGLALTAFQTGTLMAVGAAVHQDLREFKLLEGTPLLRLLLGKFIILWGLAQCSLVPFLLFGKNIWDINMHCSLGEIYLLGAVASGTFICLGLGMAPYFKNEMNYVRACLLYVVPAFLLSGYTWPLFAMPESMQWLAKVLFPITWFITPARSFILSGATEHYGMNIMVLGGISLLAIPLALRGYEAKYAVWKVKHQVES